MNVELLSGACFDGVVVLSRVPDIDLTSVRRVTFERLPAQTVVVALMIASDTRESEACLRDPRPENLSVDGNAVLTKNSWLAGSRYEGIGSRGCATKTVLTTTMLWKMANSATKSPAGTCQGGELRLLVAASLRESFYTCHTMGKSSGTNPLSHPVHPGAFGSRDLRTKFENLSGNK